MTFFGILFPVWMETGSLGVAAGILILFFIPVGLVVGTGLFALSLSFRFIGALLRAAERIKRGRTPAGSVHPPARTI